MCGLCCNVWESDEGSTHVRNGATGRIIRAPDRRRRARVASSSSPTRFDVTTETMRRDLDALEQRGALRRVHGGAVPPDRASIAEPSIAERMTVNADAQGGASRRRALEVIGDGFRGSVVLRRRLDDRRRRRRCSPSASPRPARSRGRHPRRPVAHALVARPRASASPCSADRCAASPPRRSAPTPCGAIEALRPDLAFVGANGISADFGLSTPDPAEAAVKRAIVEAARRVVVVADTSKFGVESLVRFAALDEIDMLVTDAAARRRTVGGARRGRRGGVARMIVTLTANPSLDRTITLDAPLRPGEVQRATSAREDAGGKGINVARVIAAAGVDTSPSFPLAADDPFDAALRALRRRRASACPSTAACARTSRSPTPRASRRSSTFPARPRTPPIARPSSTPSSRHPPARAGSCWPARCRPARATDFYVDVVARGARAHGARMRRSSPSTPPGRALSSVVAEAAPRPHQAQRRGARRARRRRARRRATTSPATMLARRAHARAESRRSRARDARPARRRAHHRRRRLARRRPAHPASRSTVGAGDSSLAGYLLADGRGAAPEDRLRQRRRATARPRHPSPAPRRPPRRTSRRRRARSSAST